MFICSLSCIEQQRADADYGPGIIHQAELSLHQFRLFLVMLSNVQSSWRFQTANVIFFFESSQLLLHIAYKVDAVCIKASICAVQSSPSCLAAAAVLLLLNS